MTTEPQKEQTRSTQSYNKDMQNDKKKHTCEVTTNIQNDHKDTKLRHIFMQHNHKRLQNKHGHTKQTQKSSKMTANT